MMNTAATPPSPRLWRSPLLWVLALAALRRMGRVLLSPVVTWDQAEQLVWSQHLARGYGAQPPLYTWLQWAANGVLGPTVLSLALVKQALTALTFVFLFLAARELMPARAAWLAALGLWWLPGMGWQTLRDLTHTVLLGCAVAASWWLLLRQLRRPTPAGFGWLGLALSAGLLSKYSFALIAGAALLAALSLPPCRRALRSRGWWATPLVVAVLVSPHALWVLQHWQQATGSTWAALHPDEIAGGWRGMASGVGDLVGLLALATLPWVLMAVWAFGWRRWQSPPPPAEPPPDWAWPLLRRYLGCVVAALLAMVLLGGVTHFDGRWLHPMLCVAPMAALVWRPGVAEDARGVRRYLGAVVAMALLLSLGHAIDPLIDGLRGRPDRYNWPVPQIAERLRALGYSGQAPIIADHHLIGGVLRTQFPDAPVVVCDDDEPRDGRCLRAEVAAARSAGQGWLIVGMDGVSAAWWRAALQASGTPAATPVALRLPYRRTRADAPPWAMNALWHPPAAAAR